MGNWQISETLVVRQKTLETQPTNKKALVVRQKPKDYNKHTQKHPGDETKYPMNTTNTPRYTRDMTNNILRNTTKTY